MRIVVVGATGNVGTSVVARLGGDERVEEIVGVARRVPDWQAPKTRWVRADVVRDPLEPVFRDADAVIHLAWLIQPSRDLQTLHAVNVDGSRRVFEATRAAGVPRLVHASSIGAYSPGPKDRPVDESWPTGGIETSFYSVHKAATERLLDGFVDDLRVVRLRPALIFKREAAAEIRRYFIGPLLPSALVQRRLIPFVPDHPRLVLQAVHSDDVAEAYCLAALEPQAEGAYNVAADPVLDPDALARHLGARKLKVPAGALRALAAATWRARLQPSPEGWVDMGLGVPVMDSTRIRSELGWQPRTGAGDALLELLDGLRDGAGGSTPPLAAGAGGPARLKEFVTGVGARGGVPTRR
jgi:nucleoside-diphosphate-sugar epimerase